MRKIFYNLVFNRKKRLNRKGMALVQIEAYQCRKRKYFSTHIYLRPEQWDARRQQVKNHPQQQALNFLLGEIIAELEHRELEMWRCGKTVTLTALKEEMQGNGRQNTFSEFYRQEMASAMLKESTRKNHLSTLKWLQAFRKGVTLAEMDYSFILGFEAFLREKGCHINTIAKHMRHLKRYVNAAVDKRQMDMRHYPFRKYRIQVVEGHHTYLTQEELGLLEFLEHTDLNASERHVLDAFLFCCYAGLRYSDFIHLSEENFVVQSNRTWLMYTSVKTHVKVCLPLFLLFGGKALAVWRRWRRNPASFFRLKDNSNVNKTLQRLALRAGLQKRISFHTARHTNATLLIYNGVNITTVQKLLGHKSVKTTQLYASIMDRTIVQDLQQAKKTGKRLLREQEGNVCEN